jgi:molybdate/tungstate transport system substrate-binding protein
MVGCKGAQELVSSDLPSGEVVVYHAGSLTIPFDQVEDAFEAEYPDVDVIRTPGGSRDITRKIVEFEDSVDVLVSADYAVIDTLMIPDYASWNVLFAENSMVIMYSDTSKYADEISEDNWFEVLLQSDVNYGHSEPNADPCGYRSVLTLQLAEKYYNVDDLYNQLIANRKEKNIRPKSVELIAMLETGALDYAFEYESVAMQHQMLNPELKYIKLPVEINLSSIDQKDFYAQAVIELSGSAPGLVIERKAEPIVYSLTQPTTSKNLELGELFIRFLLDEERGMKILKESGQPTLEEIVVFGEEYLPEGLKNIVK